MLIVLGGLLGSGRQLLAREIAQAHSVKLYEIKQHLHHRGYRTPEGQYSQYAVRPQNDDQRMRVYEKALKDFPMLSKQYENVIIERAFNRALREYFLAQARQFFDPVVFVWVESDDEHAERLMRRMVRRRLLRSVAGGMAIRQSQRAEFQPLLEVTPVFKNHRNRKAAAAELWEMIQDLAKQ